MLIALVIVLLVLAALLASAGPAFGVFGTGNFRANKRREEKPTQSE